MRPSTPLGMRWGGWPFVAFSLTTIYGQLVSVYQYPWAVAAVLGASWLVGRMHLPRILLWALVLGALILMDAGLIGM